MITIIDYGMGNLRSVAKALQLYTPDVKISSKIGDLQDSSALVLPGVGAFAAAMKNLEPLKETIINEVSKGKPILGICLGLQLFFEASTELGGGKGFAFLPGTLTSFREVADYPAELSIPQIGWNDVIQVKPSKLFQGLPDRFSVYFVHSFFAPLNKATIGETNYGIKYCSAVQKENIYAVQFHPEKSSANGLKILENFVKLCV